MERQQRESERHLADLDAQIEVLAPKDFWLFMAHFVVPIAGCRVFPLCDICGVFTRAEGAMFRFCRRSNKHCTLCSGSR
jgi:hypothetical protein